MEILAPKYRDNPNEKVYSLYQGVASGGGTVTVTIKKSRTEDRLEQTRTYGPRQVARGQGGQIAVLVIGGMETTLDEMQYILEARKQKTFVPKRTGGEVAQMCALLRERRNDTIRHYRRNPSEAPQPKKKTVKLHLPVGFHMMNTEVPGFRVMARV
jgi:hypothetical protein